jgi:hypothetical protein
LLDAGQTLTGDNRAILSAETEGVAMPADIAVVVGAVTAAFLIFAAALAWGDLQTRRARRPQAGE